MNRIELEQFVEAKRQSPNRNYYKDHSMDECIERILETEDRRRDDPPPRKKDKK